MRISISSARSVGERPAAGSSNRMKRGAPASASAISSWRCWPWLSSRDELVLHVGQVHGLHEVLGRLHQPVVAARAQQREAPARDAAAGEIDVVDHRQAGEQRRDLIGAAQAAPDALVRREVRHVLAEEADGAGGRGEIAGDAVEQRGLAGAVRAEHGAPLARAHRQRDVGQRRERAEQPRHAAQLERVGGADGAQAFGDGERDRHQALPSRALLRAWRARQRAHRPRMPSGENSTISRKPRPIRSWKRLPSRPTMTSASSAKVRRMT